MQGSRSPEMDEGGLPLNGQAQDTLVTWVPPSPVPRRWPHFRSSGSRAPACDISKLSIDGKISPGPRGCRPRPRPRPSASLRTTPQNFTLDQLRVVRTGSSLRASSGNSTVNPRQLHRNCQRGHRTHRRRPCSASDGDRDEQPCRGLLDRGAGAGWRGSCWPVPSGRGRKQRHGPRFADTGPSNPFALRIGRYSPGRRSCKGPFRPPSWPTDSGDSEIRDRSSMVGRRSGEPTEGDIQGNVDLTFANNAIEEAEGSLGPCP